MGRSITVESIAAADDGWPNMKALELQGKTLNQDELDATYREKTLADLVVNIRRATRDISVKLSNSPVEFFDCTSPDPRQKYYGAVLSRG